MNCIAVDDEKLVLELVVDNIKQVPYLNLVKACKNAMEAIEVLQRQKIDLIFLDIQMPKLSGLQFIQTLPQPPMIIFITAYDKYAMEGYNLNVVDYLLKPVSLERFLKACNKAKELFDFRNDKLSPNPKEDTPDHIFVHVEYTLVKILFADILFIEGLKDYVKIWLKGIPKAILTIMSLKSLESQLPTSKFMRVHRSFIVSLDKVTSMTKNSVQIGKMMIAVGDQYKEAFSQFVGKWI